MGAYSHFQLPSESILGSSAAINDEAHFQEVPFLFDKTFLQKKSSYSHLQKCFHSDSIFNQVGTEH